MNEIIVEIKRNQKIAKKTYEMVLACEKEACNGCGSIHGITNPGQFINIKLDGFFLRRPISICDWTEDTIAIIYKTVGNGTETMSRMKPGEKLNILTSLGNGYETADSGKMPLLIGGGAGVPPMYGLCKKFIEEGKSPKVILGFNTAEEVFYEDRFKALGVKTIVTTTDGSVGVKGFVTDAIHFIEAENQTETPAYTSFCACGPEAMLKALDKAIDADIPGQLSFEERMGCGFGACMGCSCETKYGYKRICKEGPVLERGEIIW